jgi:type IV pilus assembly protein PilA
MKKMQKGFTLIELMVVVVIIGILAAVAVPKMFGMSAKAKAAEVGPSAASYERLQAAYFQETNETGDLTQIGFDAPGNSKTFSYAEATAATASQADLTITNDQAALNDCPLNSNWSTTVSINGAGTLQRLRALSDATNCGNLTPNFADAAAVDL